MLGRLVAFVVRRATKRTADSIERQVVWSLIGGFFSIAAIIFGLLLLFWILQQQFDSITAAAILCGLCLLAGLVGFGMPKILDAIERRRANTETTPAKIAETVEEETHAAVDYLGPLQLIASAFLLGMSTGRSVGKRS